MSKTLTELNAAVAEYFEHKKILSGNVDTTETPINQPEEQK